MLETLTALTVPGEWDEKSLNLPPFEKIVGLSADNQELLLPDNPKEYWYGGGYREGYSKQEVTERTLSLSNNTGQQLVQFFDQFLLKMQWRDIGILSEKYDCHWLANWLKGVTADEATTDYTLKVADETILNGVRIDKPLVNEQIGVIGGLCLSQSEPYAEAHHSFIALDETYALQATGMHGAIAIATQSDTLRYYQETSWASMCIEEAGIDVFSSTDD